MVDYYSNFIAVDLLKETTSEQVIDTGHNLYGPQFSSEKPCQFHLCDPFEHRTSSPHYPQTNGKAKKQNKQ